MNNMQQEMHQLKETVKSNVQQSGEVSHVNVVCHYKEIVSAGTPPLSPILKKVPSVAPRVEVLNVQVLSGTINENLEFPNFEGQVSEIEIDPNEQVLSGPINENPSDKIEIPNTQVPEIVVPIDDTDTISLERLLPILKKEPFRVVDDLLRGGTLETPEETPEETSEETSEETPESFTPRQEFLVS